MFRRPPFVSHALGWTLFASSILFLLAAVGVGAITYERAYENRIFPGVRIGTIPVGELSRAEAATRVRGVLDTYLGKGLPYVLDGKLVNINPIVIGQQDPDISYTLVDVDVPALVEEAYAIGRRPALVAAWIERVRGATHDGLTVPLDVTVASERLEQALAENLGGNLVAMEPPRLRATSRDGTVTWEVTAGRVGRTIDAAGVAGATATRIATLDPAAILVATSQQSPPYTKADVESVLPELDAALRRAPISLTYGDQHWQVGPATLATWFTLQDGPTPALDRAAINTFLTPITAAIERPAEDARLSIDPTTKRVREFRAAHDGTHIDRDALATALHAAVFGTATPLVPIPTTVVAPAVAVADTNDLGIRELLGVGKTNARGSPPNRHHNIGVGTALLNGILIEPNEEFSLVGALTPFDETNGYKAELVIKGSRTTPEFGGGLCQVATTMFRTALAAGLPITERVNHAYRVPYYEPPAGMDATIYGPKPDFRFRNDTGHALLLRTRVNGDDLTYELWGTKDGRLVQMSEPEVGNFVTPPPMKTVETEDLPPGTKKCTEKAHTGADAKFTYTVAYPDGRKEERVFRSHYRPWQAVCLVGVKPQTPTLGPGQAGSRPLQTDGPAPTETGTPGATTPMAPATNAPTPAPPIDNAPPQID